MVGLGAPDDAEDEVLKPTGAALRDHPGRAGAHSVSAIGYEGCVHLKRVVPIRNVSRMP
ncbi:hypothetical protein GCM10018953_01710 [Streptosporangium nondiastaticum]